MIECPELIPCRFCQVIPKVDLRIDSGDNPMYVFAIRHSCDGFEAGHLSLFFQNDLSPERCKQILQKSVDLYSSKWNERNAIEPVAQENAPA